MNARDELAQLIAQAAEHLRYYQELGLTHIGEQHAPDAAEPQISEEPPPASAPPPIALPLVSPQPPATPVTITTMNRKQVEQNEAPSLFADAGEAAPPPVSNETLADIRAELGDCQRCKLGKTRTKLVFGEGSEKAELMFIGEAPGADEDATGRPFVGRAGQLLTKMIEAIGLKREDVYIANVLKSRPPGNRNPEKDEVEACIPFLFRQIIVIRPRLIVALGNPAMQSLLDTKIGITRMRGEFHDYPRFVGIKVLPTFHPAYLLRSPDKKREAWEDLKKVRAFLRGESEG